MQKAFLDYFKMNSKFMTEKKKIALERIVEVKYLRFLYQIDQPFFVTYVKNNLIKLLTIFDYQAIQSRVWQTQNLQLNQLKK